MQKRNNDREDHPRRGVDSDAEKDQEDDLDECEDVHLPPSLHLDIALVRILGRKSQSQQNINYAEFL